MRNRGGANSMIANVQIIPPIRARITWESVMNTTEISRLRLGSRAVCTNCALTAR